MALAAFKAFGSCLMLHWKMYFVF